MGMAKADNRIDGAPVPHRAFACGHLDQRSDATDRWKQPYLVAGGKPTVGSAVSSPDGEGRDVGRAAMTKRRLIAAFACECGGQIVRMDMLASRDSLSGKANLLAVAAHRRASLVAAQCQFVANGNVVGQLDLVSSDGDFLSSLKLAEGNRDTVFPVRLLCER